MHHNLSSGIYVVTRWLHTWIARPDRKCKRKTESRPVLQFTDSWNDQREYSGRFEAKPSRVFRFEEIREAHRIMEANEAGGKMVVVHD